MGVLFTFFFTPRTGSVRPTSLTFHDQAYYLYYFLYKAVSYLFCKFALKLKIY